MVIRCHIDRLFPSSIDGWAFDPAHPDVALHVEIFYEGRAVGMGVASVFRPDLRKAGFHDGQYGFTIGLGDTRVTDPRLVRAVFRHPSLPGREASLLGEKLTETGEVDFGSAPLRVLQPLGLALHTLRGKVRLGPSTSLEPPLFIQALIAPGTTIEAGAFTGIYGKSINRLRIGRYCQVAPEAVIGPNEHPTDWLTTSLVAEHPDVHDWDRFVAPDRSGEIRKNVIPFGGNAAKTVIGNDVWIGSGAFVRSGVTIGDGAIVGAHAMVTRDVPPYAIVVGNPARVLRLRFPEPLIERLLALRWWRYSLYDLSGTRFDRVEEALDAIEERAARGEIKEYRPEPWTPARLRAALAEAPPSS